MLSIIGILFCIAPAYLFIGLIFHIFAVCLGRESNLIALMVHVTLWPFAALFYIVHYIFWRIIGFFI